MQKIALDNYSLLFVPVSFLWGVSSSPGIVQGGALSSVCTQIMTTVDQEQNKVLWIPAGPL